MKTSMVEWWEIHCLNQWISNFKRANLKSRDDFPPILSLQQFGKILDVEIIFNERGSKVSFLFLSPVFHAPLPSI